MLPEEFRVLRPLPLLEAMGWVNGTPLNPLNPLNPLLLLLLYPGDDMYPPLPEDMYGDPPNMYLDAGALEAGTYRTVLALGVLAVAVAVFFLRRNPFNNFFRPMYE